MTFGTILASDVGVGPCNRSMPLKVFIANFGQENHLWPACRSRPSIATFDDEDLWQLRQAGDRDGYIARCLEAKRTAKGITPTRQVASRWFNLIEIVGATEGDLWIHREKDELWWTTSRTGEPEVVVEPAFKPFGDVQKVYVQHKPADPWSNKSRRGTPLDWNALHPRAREFLFTEGTLQQLSPDNEDYAKALVEGDDLEPWHKLPAWKTKAERAKRGAVTYFDAKQRAVVRMVQTATATAAASRGQVVERTVKNKEVRFGHPKDFEDYVAALVAAQDGLCAVTGLRLQYDGDDEDIELLCSLDRIDSSGHYEAGNLQVVCRFANRWKNDGDNAEFRRLIAMVKDAPRTE